MSESQLPAYAFGKNWSRYVTESFSELRLESSRQHLLKFLGLDNLENKVFLDIGCGSGLHSLAALSSGAKQVISIDVDNDSVAACKALWHSIGKPENWNIAAGSILDKPFVESLPKADVVYSWGVFHHTGDLWKAFQNAVIPLEMDGVMYVALYASEPHVNPGPEYWIDLKKRYNQASEKQKEEMEYLYAWERVLKPRADLGENPLLVIRDYFKERGMEFWTDIRDWLGGYPMDFASARQVHDFAANQLNLELLQLKTGEANTEYLFRKQGAHNIWDTYLELTTVEPLMPPFERFGAHGYRSYRPDLSTIADNVEFPFQSPMHLYEDGLILGYMHAPIDDIAGVGNGRYAHWSNYIKFSSSDNSDPNKNGRHYSIRIPSV